jgi:hypothetical protein
MHPNDFLYDMRFAYTQVLDYGVTVPNDYVILLCIYKPVAPYVSQILAQRPLEKFIRKRALGFAAMD